ncbi:MAG: TRAP transporter small permease [Burkholderiales bacterium]|nr:MAG: TRAP transporter small permease [Burkholderiales bacterium]
MTAGEQPTVRGPAFWLGTAPSLALGTLSCLFLFAMMLLTFVDVAGRYLFSSPLPAAYELVAFTMPCIIFCALPGINLRDGHVTIDLLDTFVPYALRRSQRVTVHLVSAAVMLFIAWQLAARARDHLRFEQVTDELYLPLWPFSTMMSVLSVVASITLLVAAYGQLRGIEVAPRIVEEEAS